MTYTHHTYEYIYTPTHPHTHTPTDMTYTHHTYEYVTPPHPHTPTPPHTHRHDLHTPHIRICYTPTPPHTHTRPRHDIWTHTHTQTCNTYTHTHTYSTANSPLWMLALSTKLSKFIEGHLQFANQKKALPIQGKRYPKPCGFVWVDSTAWYRKAYRLWQNSISTQKLKFSIKAIRP